MGKYQSKKFEPIKLEKLEPKQIVCKHCGIGSGVTLLKVAKDDYVCARCQRWH